MIIQSLELQDYRNYSNLKMEFEPGVNVLYGDNAQGKTNLLESVFLCGTTKSHRGCKDREIIRFGKEESHIRLVLEKNGSLHRIDVHLRKNKTKGVAIDGISIRKYNELFGMIHVVVFSPEDLGIVKNGPAERRRFLNMELCQLDKVYFYYLTRYNRILKQRNQLLKQISFHPGLEETLDIWDEQLAECGTELIRRRGEFIREMNKISGKIHRSLSGNKEKLQLIYEPDVREKEFREALKKKRSSDIHFMSTNTGPHRDDIRFLVNEIDIRQFGSQGQQRTTSLSLKLSEIELVKRIKKDPPVLLLDDVLSELDQNRRKFLLDSIRQVQTIVTCTGMDEFTNGQIPVECLYYVHNGMAERKEMEEKNHE